jgi:hypothetical protein
VLSYIVSPVEYVRLDPGVPDSLWRTGSKRFPRNTTCVLP